MIVLSDKIRITAEFRGKSKYPFWKNIQKGDIITIAMQLKFTGKYKPDLTLTNENTGETYRDSLNMIYNYFDKIGYEEFVVRNQNDYEEMIKQRKPVNI